MSTESYFSKEGLLNFQSDMKQVNLDFTSKQKESELLNQEVISAVDAQREADRLRNEAAWVSDYGMNTGIGKLTNLAASFVEGGARTLGDVASMPSNIAGAAAIAGSADEARTAYGVVKQFESQEGAEMTPEIQAAYDILNQETLVDVMTGEKKTARAILDSGLESLSTGEKIHAAFYGDNVGIANSTNKDELHADLANRYDGGVNLFQAGADQYEKGNYGQAAIDMLAGAKEILAGTVDAASNPMAIAEYTAENLPQLLLGVISPVSMALTSAGYSTDVFRKGLTEFQKREGRLPNTGEVSVMLAASATAGAVDLVADKGLVDAVTKSTGSIVKNTAKAMGKEAVTEAYQTLVEENLSSLDKDIKGKEIYTAAVIGGAVGGTMSTAGSSNQLVKNARDSFNSAKETMQSNSKENKKLIDEAIKSGDFSNVESNPVVHMDALLKQSTSEVPVEKQRENFSKAVETYNTQLQKAEEMNNQLAEVIESKGEKSKEAKNLGKAVNVMMKSIDEMTSKLQAEQQRMLNLNTTDVDTLVQEAVEGKQESVDTLLGSFDIDNSSLSIAQAESLASSPSVTRLQKTKLDNYVEFQKQASTIDEVNSLVISGGKDKNGQRFIGLREYKDFINAAINNGNEDSARKHLTNMDVFNQRHKLKAIAAKQAIEGGKGSPAYQRYSTVYGSNMNSAALAQTIQKESDLLAMAVKQEQNLLDIAFPSTVSETVTEEISEVTDTVEPVVEEVVEDTVTEAVSVVVTLGKSTYTVDAENRVMNTTSGKEITAKGRKNKIIAQADTQRKGITKTPSKPVQLRGRTVSKDKVTPEVQEEVEEYISPDEMDSMQQVDTTPKETIKPTKVTKNPEMVNAWESKSAQEFTKWASDNFENDFLRKMMGRIATFDLSNVKLKMLPANAKRKNNATFQVMSRNTDGTIKQADIGLYAEVLEGNDQFAAPERTITHEFIHAITEDLLGGAITNLTKEQSDFIKRIDKLQGALRNQVNKGSLPTDVAHILETMVDDKFEFMTYAMSDTGVQQWMSEQPSITGSKNLFTDFVKSVLSLLGLSTRSSLLTDAIYTFEQFSKDSVVQPKEVTSTTEPEVVNQVTEIAPVPKVKPVTSESKVTKTDIKNAFDSSTTNEFTSWAKDNFNDANLREIMKKISQFDLSDVSLEYVSNAKFAGLYSERPEVTPEGQVVEVKKLQVNPELFEGSIKNDAETTLTHEFIHAAISDVISNPETPEQIQFVKDLEKIKASIFDRKYEKDSLAPDSIKTQLKAMNRSIQEIPTYGTTEVGVMEWLSKQPSVLGTKSLLTDLVNSIRKLFGLSENTLRDDILFVTSGLLESKLNTLLGKEVTTVSEPKVSVKTKTGNILKSLVNNASLPLNKQNLVKAYFNGKSTNVLNKTDFMSDVFVGSEVYTETFGTDNPAVQFESFMDLNSQVSESIDGLFTEITGVTAKGTDRSTFKFEDFTQFLAIDGKIPDSVKLATTAGIHTWLMANAKGSLINTNEAINAILGNQPEDYVSPQVRELLGKVGTVNHEVIESIGKNVKKALQLNGKEDAPSYVDSKLSMSLGSLAVASMLDLGLLTKTNVDSSALGDSGTSDSQVTFLKATPSTDNDLEVEVAISELIEVNKGYNQLTKKLFDVERSRPMPSFVKPESVVTTMKGTFQNVPERVQKILKKHQETPNYLKQEELNIFRFLGLDGQRAINGYDFDVANKMKVNRDAIEGKNNAIDRELEDLQEFIDSMEDESQGFYFTHEIWKNLRIGISNVVNPQSSKIHRHLIAMKGWETQVDFTDKHKLQQFSLAVAEGLDLDVDKKTVEGAIAALDKTMAEEVMQEGIEAIKSIMNDSYTDIQDTQNKIIAAVKKGGMKTHSLDVLVNYARYSNALDQGNKSFMANAFREVDGVTNGVAIATLQFAVGNDYADRVERLNRMGMFFDNQGDSFGTWLQDSAHLDTYQSIVPIWQQLLSRNFSEMQGDLKNKLGAVINLVGNKEILSGLTEGMAVSKDERTETKYPLMVLIYGSSEESVQKAIGNQFVDNIYKKIQKAIDSGDKQLLTQVFDTINILTGSNHKVNMSREKYLEFELTNKEVKAIVGFVSEHYGMPLTESINQNYEAFVTQRKMVNAASRLAFTAFDTMYKQEIGKAIVAKKDAGTWVEGISDLSKQEKEAIRDSLKESMPIMDNYFSLESGDINDGIYTGSLDVKRQYGKQGNPYFVNPKFAKNVAGSKSMTTYGSQVMYKDGGVSPNVLTVHSMDAATMLLTYEDSNILGVHDAIGIGIDDIQPYSENINRNFMDVMVKQNLLSQAIRMYSRSMRALNQYEKDNGVVLTDAISGKVYGSLLQVGVSEDSIPNNAKDMLNKFNQVMLNQAKVTTEAKKELTDNITTMLQYNVEGGGFYPKKDSSTVIEDTVTEIFGSASNRPRDVDQLRVELASGSQSDLINNFEFDTPLRVSKMNAEEVFDNLSAKGLVKDSASHTEHLKGILTETINKVLKPFDLYLAESGDTETIGVTTLADMYIVNQANGLGQPTSGMLANGIRMSSQEVYLHELVHNVTYYGLRKKPALRREVKRLWEQAKSVLTYKDFMNEGTSESDVNYEFEVRAAKERFDYIFDRTKNTNYLDEFVAMGTTNSNIIKALSGIQPSRTETTENMNFMDKLNAFFMKVLDFVYGTITGTRNQTADKALQQLMTALAGTDARKKQGIIRKYDDTVEFANDKVNAFIGYGKSKLADVADIDLVKNSRFGVVKAAGALTRIVGRDNVEFFTDTVEKYASTITQSTDGLAGAVHSVYVEGKGRTKKNGVFHDIKRIGNNQIDQLRKRTMDITKQTINGAFSRVLTATEKATVGKLLSTDFSSLVDSLGYNSTLDLLRDDALLDEQIAKTTRKLQADNKQNGMFYTNHARNLGYFMLTEKSLLKTGVLKNAENIAKLFGSSKVTPTDWKNHVEGIDTLASLYALKFSGKTVRNDLVNLFESESKGMQFVVNMHKGFKVNSRKELESTHMVKGYMADVLNQDISFRVGTLEQQEELESQGYVLGNQLEKDPTDQSGKPMYIYTAKDGGMAMYNAGIVNLASGRARGTSLFDVRANAGDSQPSKLSGKDMVTVSQAKVTEFDKTFSNVSFKQGNYTSGIFNVDGELTGWNYLMGSHAKDTFLERDTSIDTVLSKMIADLKVKPNVRKNNSVFVKALHDQFKSDKDMNASNYVMISARSGEQRYREIWNMLPAEMKKEIKKVWGRDAMMVSKDMIDLSFGYRNYSLTEILDKSPEDRKHFEKLMGYFFERWFGKDAYRKVRNAENVVKELVSMGKDMWVIKSFFVTLANTMSNIVLLNMKGVSMKSIGYGYTVAYKAASDYKKQVRELGELEDTLSFGSLTNRKMRKLADRIAELKSELEANPVKELIDNGALQTIVEDVDTETEEGTVRNIVSEFGSRMTSRVPKPIRDAGKVALLMQGTKGYNFLRDAAQMSDFGARFILMEDLRKKGMNTVDSVGEVMDVFLDYDLPTHKMIQYGNDMGFLFFTKYLIRVIKIMYKTMKEAPARVLSILLLQNWFGNVTDIYDTGLNPFSRLGSPLDFLDAPAEIATVQAVMDL